MMIIDRPPDSSAFAANSRPTFAAAAAGTPVNCSCQAGVVVVRRGPAPGQPRPADAVPGEQQVEDGGDQPPADLADRHSAAQHPARTAGVVEARQVDGDGLAWRT